MVVPSKTETFESWNKLPHGRKLLHSLENFIRTLLLKIVSQKDLSCGLDSSNVYETYTSNMIAEVNLRYRVGVKAIGSLNSSRKWGSKNFLIGNRMPKNSTEYERQTNSAYILKNIFDIVKKVKFEEEMKASKRNLEVIRKFLPEDEADLLNEIYTRFKLRKIFPTIRWIVRQKIGL